MKKNVKRRRSKAAKNRQKKLMLIGAGVICVAAAIGLISYSSLKSSVNKVPKHIICDNIFIEDVDVSGMSLEEARAAVEQKIAADQAATVTLKADETQVEVTVEELGIQVENLDSMLAQAVSYGKEGSLWSRKAQLDELKKEPKMIEATRSINSDIAKATIQEKMAELKNGAVNATLKRENGKFVITDGEKGVTVDLEGAVTELHTYFNGDWKSASGIIELPVKVAEPEITREDLEVVQDVLGTFTTNCGTGGGRVQNIKTGAKKINGALLMPGDSFSADGAMRPYTFENGYAEAGSYENGRVVQSMGGGICQVSSTLYNACLLAELEITQRQPHSMMVSYVDPAADAAIAGDYKDLKFKNNTGHPIYIEGYVSGSYITFTIYGKEARPENRTVKYVSETLSTIPAGKKYVEAPGSALGSITKTDSGHTGMKAKLWKIVYENGKEVSRTEVNTSSYMASDSIWSVGTKSSNKEASAVVKNAIGSQKESTIKAAISKANGIIKDASKPTTPTKPTEPTEPTKPTEPVVPPTTEQPDGTETNAAE